MRRHGDGPARYAVPGDDVELANVHADMSLALALEDALCAECERCAGCLPLTHVTDCGHARCTCPGLAIDWREAA